MSEVIDRVQKTNIFPIKSLQAATLDGQPITELVAGPTGLECEGVADRAFVLSDPDGLFVSQRGWDENHSLKFPEDRAFASVAVDIRDGYLHLSAPNHGEANIALWEPVGETKNLRFFGPDLPVIDAQSHLDAPEFFSELLGREVRLTMADPHHPRMLAEKYQRKGAANRATGADGRPISLASQASLDQLHDLANVLRGSLPLINFRANVEVTGEALKPFGEDMVSCLQIDEVEAFVVKALSRCPVPNINQLTGDASQRLATKLLRPRMGWDTNGDQSQKPEPYFAVSLNHIYMPGEKRRVRVGSPVSIIDEHEPWVVLKSAQE